MLFCALRIRSRRQPPRPRWRRWIGGTLGGVAALALVVFLAIRGALQQVPDFYAKALRADPQQQALDAQRMTKQTAALVSDVQKVGRWQTRFTESQINGWLATELGGLHPEYLPDVLSDPRVKITPSAVTVAARYTDGGRDIVVSLAADLYLAEPNVVGLRIRKARAGVLPFPLETVLREISHATDQWQWRVQWRQADGDPVAEITVPAVHQRRDRAVSVDLIQLGDGEIILGGTTQRR
jgi:hypothetical protein